MTAQAFEVDLRGKSPEEVVQLLKENGFEVSRTDIPLWDNDFKETARFVWIMEEAYRLTVTTSSGEKKMLWPGENLYFLDQPEDSRTAEYGWAVIAQGAAIL